MKVVWKKVLELAPSQFIEAPEGGVLLHAREQGNEACVWFLCDPAAKVSSREILIVGTGHKLEQENNTYIGTASLHNGALMLHIFEHKKEN